VSILERAGRVGPALLIKLNDLVIQNVVVIPVSTL
jgi:hypothetical protein